MAITQPDIIRIKKRRDFVATASRGHKVVASTLVLQACPLALLNEPDVAPSMRVGFTVTKKVGNAVVRNRIRRRLKAAADEILAQNGKAGWDYVLIGRGRALDESFDIILRDLRYAIRKAAKLEDGRHSKEGGQC